MNNTHQTRVVNLCLANRNGLIEEAAAAGVCGSPWFLVDGEPFFGADRLPQIAWKLAGN